MTVRPVSYTHLDVYKRQTALTQRRRVRDGGLRVVNRFQQGRVKTVPAEEAPANYVPAAAVIRRAVSYTHLDVYKRQVRTDPLCGAEAYPGRDRADQAVQAGDGDRSDVYKRQGLGNI